MEAMNGTNSTPEPTLEDLTPAEVRLADADAVRGGFTAVEHGSLPTPKAPMTDGKPTSAAAFPSSGAATKI